MFTFPLFVPNCRIRTKVRRQVGGNQIVIRTSSILGHAYYQLTRPQQQFA